MAVVNENTQLGRWLDRVGAAVAAPTLALASSDAVGNGGRASSDVTLLLLVALFAVETKLFFSAGWMMADGDISGGFSLILMSAHDQLVLSIVLLLAGSALLTIMAGRRRSLSDDFDLMCVALMPLIVIEVANSLVFAVGLDIHQAIAIVGYGWTALLFVLAYRQTQSRSLASNEE